MDPDAYKCTQIGDLNSHVQISQMQNPRIEELQLANGDSKQRKLNMRGLASKKGKYDSLQNCTAIIDQVTIQDK